MKKLLTALIVLLALGAGGYVLSTRYSGSAQAPQVVTATVTRGDVVQTIDATGRLEAVTTVQVGTQVSGTIKALQADFNSRVRRGQVVAELEPSLFETQVEQAQATVIRLEAEAERTQVQLEDAQVKLARAKDLVARQLVPATDLETAEANARAAEAAFKAAQAQIVQAQASLNQAKVNLSHTIIRAPIDGVVISRNVDVGQTVAASMQAPTLFQIANDLTRMQVTGSVDEADIGRVRVGQRATFSVDAYPGERFSGAVTQVRLNPVIESNVVSYITVIDVANDDLRLRPGMTATVTIEVAKTVGTLRVPATALRFTPTPDVFASLGQQPVSVPDGHISTLWLLAQGHLQPVQVQTGLSDGANVVVNGGLEEGMQVATGVLQGAQASVAPAAGSPLLPFGGRGPGFGRGQRSTGSGTGGTQGGPPAGRGQ
jgi:HlyD family secretion protein